MIHTGLVSVTFRRLSPGEIVALVLQAGLQGIEWGGDIHVPHGDINRAREIRRLTEDAGLLVAAYGSYYHAGCEEEGGIPFERVLESAMELKAPTIRVWAGNRGSCEADEAWREKVIDDTYRIAALSKNAGISISFEFHSKTLTDTDESALRLMKAVPTGCVHSNICANKYELITSQTSTDLTGCIFSYWQTPISLDFKSRLKSLKNILPWLGNVHVFNWDKSGRMPLDAGTAEWLDYMDIIKSVDGDRFCLLEFVKDDSPEQFLRDAEALKHLAEVEKSIHKLNIS